VSEYLAKAAEAISSAAPRWRRKQQGRLKGNRVGKVLDELTAHLEGEEAEGDEAPVRACWRYLSNRLANLDYQGALEAGLPIGSGEIESGNRSVIQARLKRSGHGGKRRMPKICWRCGRCEPAGSGNHIGIDPAPE
jgi:hypothetical protein